MNRGRFSFSQPRRDGLVFGLAAFVLVLFFQNCDGGFKYNASSGSLTSAGGDVDKFRLTTFDSTGSVVPEGLSFDSGYEYRLEGAGPDLPVTVTWKMLTNTGNCVLKTGPGTAIRYVTCDKAGKVAIQSSAYWPDGSVTVLSTDRTTTTYVPDACGLNLSTRRIFRIANGTGTMPWNSSLTPLIVYVGQTLRVCNVDPTASHQLHTSGSPCVSASTPMGLQAYYDCNVANNANLTAPGGTFAGMYDQINGPTAAFYVKPINGQALYADTTKTASGQSCVSCHGAFSVSEKRGASFTGLKASIDANRGGMGTYSGRITDDELRAIAFSLNQ